MDIDELQFRFMQGCGTRVWNTIFILRQLQEKYLAEKKNLFFLFVDLEKAFDLELKVVVWWALKKLGIEELLVMIVQLMYRNAGSCVNELELMRFAVTISWSS